MALYSEPTCEAPAFCDDDPGSPTSGECIARCECARCPDGRACSAGRCVAIEVPDAGTVIDATVVADLGAATDVRTASPGRLVDAGCSCHTGVSAGPSSAALAFLALVAGLVRRRASRTR